MSSIQRLWVCQRGIKYVCNNLASHGRSWQLADSTTLQEGYREHFNLILALFETFGVCWALGKAVHVY
jgi:hypothetical protein